MNDTNTQETQAASGKDILVVVSKLKNYIRTSSGLNTAGSVAEVLSDCVRKLCDEAVQNAKNDGRKTVMDRDFTCKQSEGGSAA